MKRNVGKITARVTTKNGEQFFKMFEGGGTFTNWAGKTELSFITAQDRLGYWIEKFDKKKMVIINNDILISSDSIDKIEVIKESDYFVETDDELEIKGS